MLKAKFGLNAERRLRLVYGRLLVTHEPLLTEHLDAHALDIDCLDSEQPCKPYGHILKT